MLNFLSPPTDNFYKFMGIGGLTLFIACGFFLFFGMYKDDYKLINANGELFIQEAKLKAVINDLEYLPPYKNLENVDIPKLKEWVTHITDTSYSRDSLFIQSFYALPDSIRNKIQTIIFSRNEKQLKYNAIDQQIKNKKGNEGIIIFFLFFGEIVALLGGWLWFKHLQKPLNDERKNQETQKRFTGTDLSADCHSCYMTFYFNTERGTEKDGTINRFFCQKCYENGKYIEPELTFDEARKRLIIKLKELNYTNRDIQKIEKNFGKLLRWERLRTW